MQPNNHLKTISSGQGCFGVFCLWSSIGLSFCGTISLLAVNDLLPEDFSGLFFVGLLAAIPIGLIEFIGAINQYIRFKLPQLGWYLAVAIVYMIYFLLSFGFGFGFAVREEIIYLLIYFATPIGLSWFLTYINYRVLPGAEQLARVDLDDILDAQ